MTVRTTRHRAHFVLRFLIVLLSLWAGTSEAADVYGAGYFCDQATGVFRLGYTQSLQPKGYDLDYSSRFTEVLGAGVSRVQCTLANASIVVTVDVTTPGQRTVCGGAPALTLREFLVDGHPVLSQMAIDSHCGAGYALLGVGVAAKASPVRGTSVETVWGRYAPSLLIQREGRFLDVASDRRTLAPWDPEFGKPNPALSDVQIANLKASVQGACSAVLSLYDGSDTATLRPVQLVEAALQRAGLHVDRVTTSVETGPARDPQFGPWDDATISWHGHLLPQPMLSASNNSWFYVPAPKFTGWDSVTFRVYLNERAAFQFTYRVYVVDRQGGGNANACPTYAESDSRR